MGKPAIHVSAVDQATREVRIARQLEQGAGDDSGVGEDLRIRTRAACLLPANPTRFSCRHDPRVRRRRQRAVLRRSDGVGPGLLPDQRVARVAAAPCSISLVLTRSFLRRQLSGVGGAGTPRIRRNSSAGMTCITRPSPSRMVTGAGASSSATSLRPVGFMTSLLPGAVAALDAGTRGHGF
jgi:hypothetical protein